MSITAGGETLQLTGLTKRELFAAMATQGMVSAITGFRKEMDMQDIIVNRPRDVAEIACVYADALIAKLAKEQP